MQQAEQSRQIIERNDDHARGADNGEEQQGLIDDQQGHFFETPEDGADGDARNGGDDPNQALALPLVQDQQVLQNPQSNLSSSASLLNESNQDREWDRQFKFWLMKGGERPGPHPRPNHGWNIDPEKYTEERTNPQDWWD